MSYPRLLSPARIGDLDLPNSMVMSPMTRFRVSETGVPLALNATYYAQRAGAGLVIGEYAYVEPRGRISPRAAGIHTPEQVAGWRNVTDTIHARGGRMFLQLGHCGRCSHPSLQPDGGDPVAPSAIAEGGTIRIVESEAEGVVKVPTPTPRALETGEIAGVVESFRAATANAAAAGFDGVELHSGSGFLQQQFLTAVSNQRTDRYGGSVANRCRFVLETLEAMSEVRGPGRVGVKIAPSFAYHGMTMDYDDMVATYDYLARALSALKLGYVHVQFPPWGLYYGPKDFAPIRFIRDRYQGLVIGAGEFDRDTGEAALARSDCDLIAFGRRFIANPDLPRRIALGAPENGWDESTLYGPSAEGFTDFPTLESASA